MKILPTAYIISANRSHLDKFTAARLHESLGNYLMHPKKTVEGFYGGQIEQSWFVVPFDVDIKDEILSLLNEYSQDCALYLDANRQAYYLYPDGNLKHLGNWSSSSREKALEKNAYTFDPSTNRYFIVTWRA